MPTAGRVIESEVAFDTVQLSHNWVSNAWAANSVVASYLSAHPGYGQPTRGYVEVSGTDVVYYPNGAAQYTPDSYGVFFVKNGAVVDARKERTLPRTGLYVGTTVVQQTAKAAGTVTFTIPAPTGHNSNFRLSIINGDNSFRAEARRGVTTDKSKFNGASILDCSQPIDLPYSTASAGAVTTYRFAWWDGTKYLRPTQFSVVNS